MFQDPPSQGPPSGEFVSPPVPSTTERPDQWWTQQTTTRPPNWWTHHPPTVQTTTVESETIDSSAPVGEKPVRINIVHIKFEYNAS